MSCEIGRVLHGWCKQEIKPSSTQWLVRCPSLSKAKEIMSSTVDTFLLFLFGCIHFQRVLQNCLFNCFCRTNIFLETNRAFTYMVTLLSCAVSERLRPCALWLSTLSQPLVPGARAFFTKSLQRVNCATVSDKRKKRSRVQLTFSERIGLSQRR